MAKIERTQLSLTVKELGQMIVVLDRGFVYVGEVTDEGEWLRITNGKNIRVWGTTNGLLELSNGPTPSTKLDGPAEIIAPKRAVIHCIKCQGF